MKVGIIGAGAWGCALGILCEKAGNFVVLWSFAGVTADFPGLFAKNIQKSREFSDLTDCDLWLVVTPSEFFRETIRNAKKSYNGQPVIICTKGMEAGTGKLMSEIIGDELPECRNIGVLSGPQFAGEVADGRPTGSTLAGNSVVRGAGRIAFSKLYLQETDDIIGAQICGVGKNAVALIMGYVANRGENEKAMLLTRAWGEVVEIGLARGAKIETFLSLCGIGDLFLTATSMTSRNYSAGKAMAESRVITGTVEGLTAIKGLTAMARDLDIAIPILNMIDL